MEYNVTAIPKDEFLHYVELVQRSMDSRRSDVKATKLDINRVTEDYKEFDPFANEAKILRSSTVGQAWVGFGRIWMKPGRSLPETRVTAIHEISHLAEKDQAHGPKWRRVFCVALAHHLRERGNDEYQVKAAIRDHVRRYRKYRMDTPQGNRNPYSEYLNKVDAEVNSIYRASRKG